MCSKLADDWGRPAPAVTPSSAFTNQALTSCAQADEARRVWPAADHRGRGRHVTCPERLSAGHQARVPAWHLSQQAQPANRGQPLGAGAQRQRGWHLSGGVLKISNVYLSWKPNFWLETACVAASPPWAAPVCGTAAWGHARAAICLKVRLCGLVEVAAMLLWTLLG